MRSSLFLAKNTFSSRMSSNFGQMRRSMQMIQQPRFGFATMEKTFLSDDLQVNLRADPKPKPGPDHLYLFG